EGVQRRPGFSGHGGSVRHLRKSTAERLALLSVADDGRIDAALAGDLSHDGIIQVTEAKLLGHVAADRLGAGPIHLRHRNGTVAHGPPHRDRSFERPTYRIVPQPG